MKNKKIKLDLKNLLDHCIKNNLMAFKFITCYNNRSILELRSINDNSVKIFFGFKELQQKNLILK